MPVLKRSIASVRVNIQQRLAYTRLRVSIADNRFTNLQFLVPLKRKWDEIKNKRNYLKRKKTTLSISWTVAWFTFDPQLSNADGSGLVFSNDLSTVSMDGWDHRVALGSVGFSRGIHYWEFTITKYTPDTDPAFGIARIDVARDQMLGKSILNLVINLKWKCRQQQRLMIWLDAEWESLPYISVRWKQESLCIDALWVIISRMNSISITLKRWRLLTHFIDSFECKANICVEFLTLNHFLFRRQFCIILFFFRIHHPIK